MLTLIALNGQEKGRVFQLAGEAPELLGRLAPMIKLADAQTSRKHAEIILQNNTWLIRDLGSTNGTWVNGQKIFQITELESGDRIVVGRHQFRVSKVSDLPAPTPQPTTPKPEPVIGSEELAMMGVDLSESLSADLLDDDGDLPELPEDSFSDDRDATGATDSPDRLIATGIPAAIDEPATPEIPAAPADQDDGVIDLDALLADNTPAESDRQAPPPIAPEASGLTGESEADHTSAPVTPEHDEQIPETNDTTADDGVIDLDALLADEQPSTPVGDVPIEEAHDPDDADIQADLSEPKPTHEETPSVSDDVVIDLDALLDDVTDESEGGGKPAIDTADVLDDVEAIDNDLVNQAEPPSDSDEQAEDAPPTQAEETDSLIDVDILGAAVPSATLGADVDEDQADDDAADDVLNDLSAELDEKPESETAEVDEPEHGSAGEADEAVSVGAVGEVGIEDAEDVDSDESLTSLPPEEDVSEADKELLLSANEQEQAVSSYRRSKLMTVVILFVCLGVLGGAGWFGYSFLNRNSAASQPADMGAKPAYDEQPVSDAGTATTTESAGVVADQSEQPIPDVTDPIVMEPDLSTEPNNTTTDTAEDLATIPDEINTQAWSSGKAPTTDDAFADIWTPNTDPPDVAKPTEASPEPSTPSLGTPEPEVPEAGAGERDTPVEQPTQDGETVTDSNENQPESDTTTDGAGLDLEAQPESEPTDNSPATAPDAAEQPVAESVAGEETDDASQDNDLTTAAGLTGARPGELEALSGAIDAPHQPGDRIAGQADFAGTRKIVFVVDASGSLVDSFPRVLEVLDRAIVRLPEEQAFTVIFFGVEGVTEVPPVGLRWADGQNKRQLREWLSPELGNVNAWGRGDPLEALQRAINYRPDEVVILSDNLIGRRVSQEAVTDLLNNIAEMVGEDVEMIHVIQFFNRDPQQVLKRIAEQFNGTYNLVVALPSASVQTAVDDDLVQP